jgi:magnesium-transporting ATPase (P-type)
MNIPLRAATKRAVNKCIESSVRGIMITTDEHQSFSR